MKRCWTCKKYKGITDFRQERNPSSDVGSGNVFYSRRCNACTEKFGDKQVRNITGKIKDKITVYHEKELKND